MRKPIIALASVLASASAVAVTISFPWSTDPEGRAAADRAAVEYYQRAYSAPASPKQISADLTSGTLSPGEESYLDFGRRAALVKGIPEQVGRFVERYGLKRSRILDVGAGSGLLQDLVEDYTGLDVSPTARRFFHKPFVEASATSMPFADSSFDALWSIWVLEHIPNPERALMEMRRVVRSGGYMFLAPAFEVARYAAQGYDVRPFRELDWKGRFIKALAPVARSDAYYYLQAHQIRLLRSLGARLGAGPSRLHFVRLTPNYEHFWQADSDAAVSLTHHELYLWFKTRGDEVLDCPPEYRMVLRRYDHLAPLTVRVRKP